MRLILAFLLLFGLGASAADRMVVVNTNGVLLSPTNLWVANSNGLAAALGALGSGSGDVVGPASATAGSLALFSGTTGKLLSSSALTEANVLTESEAAALYATIASPTFTGGVTFDTGTFGTLIVTTNLFVADVAYGPSWDASTNVPTRNAVYDKIQSLLTLFQGTNANLTTLATLNGGSLTNLNGAAIASGQIPIARMATGTPDGTKFIRDDGTLATPVGSVTSVGATSTVAGLNFSGSPITGSGTLSLTGVVGVASIDSAVATDSELSAHAALTNSHGVSLFGALVAAQTTAANFRSQLGLGTAALKADTDFQATNANLTTLATLDGGSLTNLNAEPLNSNKYQATNTTLTALAGLNGTGLTNVMGYSGYFTSGPVRLVPIGDSLTSGSGSTNGGYPYYLTNRGYITQANWVVPTNVGVANRQIGQILSTYYTNDIQYLKPAGGTNAIAMLWCGVNDIQGFNQSGETTFGIWSNLVVQMRSDGFKILAITVTPSAWHNSSNAVSIMRYNEMIRDSPLWDWLYDAANEMPAPPFDNFYSDAIHFTDPGYDRIARGVGRALRRPARTYSVQERVYATGPNTFGGVSQRGYNAAMAIRSYQYPAIMWEAGENSHAMMDELYSFDGTGRRLLHLGSGNFSNPGDQIWQFKTNYFRIQKPFSVTDTSSASNLTAAFAVPTASKTANYTVTALEGNAWINNNGASGAVTNTLPAAFEGRQYGFVILAAQTLVIKAAGSDTIRILGTVSAGGGQAATNVVGTTLHLHCPVAGQWVADSQIGAWAVQ